MDQSIERLGQDLARANYAEKTRKAYVQTAGELAKHCGKPVAELTRDDLRGYVDSLQGGHLSPHQQAGRLGAVLFLFRRTLGRAELVSFIKLPRRHSPLPSVLSAERQLDFPMDDDCIAPSMRLGDLA